jgi:hypothetical protein
MTREEFQALMDRHYQTIRGINDSKGDDYAGAEDALRNFKEQAVRLGLTPYKVWGVLADKHWFAIESFIKNGKLQSEPIEGRLHDIILYSFLLLGLIEETEPRFAAHGSSLEPIVMDFTSLSEDSAHVSDPTDSDPGIPSTGQDLRSEAASGPVVSPHGVDRSGADDGRGDRGSRAGKNDAGRVTSRHRMRKPVLGGEGDY